MKILWFLLSLLAAPFAMGNDKLIFDFGNHAISQDTECGKRANSVLQHHQKKLIAAPAFGLPELGADSIFYAALMKHMQGPSFPLPPGVIQIILFAPRVDGMFRDVYVVCPSGKIIFSDRGGIVGQATWYGPVDLSVAIGESVTPENTR